MKVFIAVVVLILIVGALIIPSVNRHEIIGTVTEKVVKNNDNNGKYLVGIEKEDGAVVVLQNTDNLLQFKFNSSDSYFGLEIGKKYKFTVIGFRIPIFSAYENIVEYKEVN